MQKIKHEKVCNDHDYCYVEMPNEYNKILKYNHGEKSIKAPAIYVDLECLLEKMHSCQIMTACSCHVTYVFQSESTLYSCLNVKELLA